MRQQFVRSCNRYSERLKSKNAFEGGRSRHTGKSTKEACAMDTTTSTGNIRKYNAVQICMKSTIRKCNENNAKPSRLHIAPNVSRQICIQRIIVTCNQKTNANRSPGNKHKTWSLSQHQGMRFVILNRPAAETPSGGRLGGRTKAGFPTAQHASRSNKAKDTLRT